MTTRSQEYFVRQAALPDIGPSGLAKLKESTVGIAGAGGVGSSVAYYLSRSGVGRIVLVDQDVVEPSNLQRLHGVSREDLFHPKAEAISKRLSASNDVCHLDPVVETITNRNVGEFYRDVDIVIDGLDNFRTRYIVNDFAKRTGTPYLFASAVAEQAHLTIINPPYTACLECLMPAVSDKFENSCESLGISPVITGLVGAVAASEAAHLLIGQTSRLAGQMLTIDGIGPEFIFTAAVKREDCGMCSTPGRFNVDASPRVTYLCGEHTANVLPPVNMNLDLHELVGRVVQDKIRVTSDSVFVFDYGPFIVSLFRTGRLLIGGVKEEEEVTKVVEGIWKMLRVSVPISQTA